MLFLTGPLKLKRTEQFHVGFHRSTPMFLGLALLFDQFFHRDAVTSKISDDWSKLPTPLRSSFAEVPSWLADIVRDDDARRSSLVLSASRIERVHWCIERVHEGRTRGGLA